jgi:aspartate/glutamate racemase
LKPIGLHSAACVLYSFDFAEIEELSEPRTGTAPAIFWRAPRQRAGLLIGPEDVEVPLHDTTRLHARAAVTLALEAA